MTPEPVKKFVDLVAELPSIGPRQATRLAYHLVNRGESAINELANAVAGLRALKNCPQCFRVATVLNSGLCSICADAGRTDNVIAIVEKETDLMSLEKTKKFPGRYLVIGELEKTGILSPVQKLRLKHLIARVKLQAKELGRIDEIIVALDPTTYGNIQASVIVDELKPYAKKITRLGRGLPTGGEIEFADEDTLGGALEHRS